MANNTASGSGDCRLEPAERNRYFFGKLLTARDFELEQNYHIEKVRAIHRFIHGTGIVCGLQVEDPHLADGKFTVILHPGVGYDCCGRQIVVPQKESVTVHQESALAGEGFLYLRYDPVPKEHVPTLPNTASEEPDCRPSRTLERFEVVFSDESPPAAEQAFVFNSPKGDLEARNIELSSEYYRERLRQCPECSQPRVFLAALRIQESTRDAGDPVIDEEKTNRLRQVVFSNRMIRDLLLGHLQNYDNPHQTTAEQVGALVSVDGVNNPGGDVDLKAKDAITLKADQKDHSITVGESHSRRIDNPHKVSASQVGALTGINQVESPGGSIELRSSDRSIEIEAQPERNAINLTTRIAPDGRGRIFYGQASVKIDQDGFAVPELISVESLREGEPFTVMLLPVLDGQQYPPFNRPALTPGLGDHAVFGGLAKQNLPGDLHERTFVAFIPKSRDSKSGDWAYQRKFEIHGIARDFKNQSVPIVYWIIAGARPVGAEPTPLDPKEAVLDYLRKNERGGTLPGMSRALGIPVADLDAILKQLIGQGAVQVKRGRYQLVEEKEEKAEARPEPQPEPKQEPQPEPKPGEREPEKPPPPPTPPSDEDPILSYLRTSERGGTLPTMSKDLGIPIADLSARLKVLIDEKKVEVRGGRYQLVK